jgi:drug/metabolite transporter (DMT)-like permease
MAAIGFALAASLSWGVGDFVSGIKTRAIGTFGFLVPAQFVGLVLAGILVAARGDPWPGARILLAVPAAAASTLGLIAFLRGMSIGALSLVTPIAGASSIVPVVFGLGTGETLGLSRLLGIAAAVVGVMLVSYTRLNGSLDVTRGAGLAVVAALAFGLYFPPMHAAAEVDPYWALLVFRLGSFTLAAAIGMFLMTAAPGVRDLPLVALAGLLDVGGNLLYALASAAHGLLSIVSVLSTVYPIVTVALATLLLHERPRPAQWLGVVLTLSGVGLISAG